MWYLGFETDHPPTPPSMIRERHVCEMTLDHNTIASVCGCAGVKRSKATTNNNKAY